MRPSLSIPFPVITVHSLPLVFKHAGVLLFFAVVFKVKLMAPVFFFFFTDYGGLERSGGLCSLRGSGWNMLCIAPVTTEDEAVPPVSIQPRLGSVTTLTAAAFTLTWDQTNKRFLFLCKYTVNLCTYQNYLFIFYQFRT